jgi:predicted ArsR family transcriptional regulator
MTSQECARNGTYAEGLLCLNTAVELSQHLGLTLRAVEKQLAKLKQEGVLRRVGRMRAGIGRL